MNHKEEIKEGDYIAPSRGGTVYKVKKVLKDGRTGQVYAFSGISQSEVLLKVENVRKLSKPAKLKAV